MALNPNQFKMTTEQGVMDLQMNPNVISAIIDPTDPTANPIVAGQAVTLVDDGTGIPKVRVATVDTANIYGFILLSKKKQVYKKGDRVEIAAFRGNCMYMTASAAIARGANVMVVIASNKVATATGAGKTIVGQAYDKATADGQVIRVMIDLPGAKVP